MTRSRLIQVLAYNPCTGLFTWKESRPGVGLGKVAGTLRTTGYIAIWIDRRPFLAHRLAWLYIYGEWPWPETDHIDRNKTNNSIWNLRVVDRSMNMRNSPHYKGGISRTKEYIREYSRTYYLKRKLSQLQRED